MFKIKSHAWQGFSRFVPLLIFTVSLGLGTAAVVYAQRYIDQQVSEHKGKLDLNHQMVEVVVANRLLQRGDTITADDLALREIPEEYLDPSSVTLAEVDTAIGQRLAFDLDAGRPLTWVYLAGAAARTFSGLVDDGLRAMTVRVDEINSISGLLQPGDRVDLLLSHGQGEAQNIVPFLQNLSVMATGVQTNIHDADQVRGRSFATITVHVKPEDAQRITLAQQVGRITAILRNPQDSTASDTTPITVAQLLNARDKPATSDKHGSGNAKRTLPSQRAIQYIIGGR